MYENNLSQELAQQEVNYILQQQDESIENHTYVDEEVLFDLVKSGDIQKVESYVEKSRPKYPMVIENSMKKSEEYMAVVMVALLARAVLEAGVTSKESFQLSDVFLKRIARCEDAKSIIQESKNAMIAFTQLAASCKQRIQSNKYVEDCKKDIAMNIFKKISLSDIAKDIGIEESYLARLFKRSEGLTVGQYIQKEKIHVSKNLLKYSDRSISEISDYLCFNSQSYFGKRFKEVTGITPNEYRNQYHGIEF
jgi:AraC-like DNA-binding protein/uncharacterized protein YuzE